ncbi:hypothetical protein ACEPPN_000712 [Leptodophora sp. 'Broadleaf-Isolate-01']
MQGFSARGIKEELKADGYEFSTRSQKTLENRLEDWGFTLNPEIRRLLNADLRKQVADLVKDDCDRTGYTMSSMAHPKQHQTVISSNLISSSNKAAGSPINRPDSPTFSPLASVPQAMDLCPDATFTYPNGGLHPSNDPQANFGSGLTIPEASNSLLDASEGHFGLSMDFELDFNSGTDIVEGNLEFRSQNIPSHIVDADSAYFSMENQAGITSKVGIINHQPFRPDISFLTPGASFGTVPEAEHIFHNGADLYTPFTSSRTSDDILRSVSILHKIPCENDHTPVRHSEIKTCECGVRIVHAMCMRIPELDDHQMLKRLKGIPRRDTGVTDGAGNTALHYIAETGRKDLLEYMLNSGAVDIQCRNTLGQNFLHVLDGTCFGDELGRFLLNFKGFGLLDQRDHHGRTILHSLFRYQIKQSVCRQVLELYGPTTAHHVALRDNQGKNAAQYLRDLSEQLFPFASYAHSDYAQTIVLLENYAKSFTVTSSAVDENPHRTPAQEMQERMLVCSQLQAPNTEDLKGKNALHCLASWPTGRSSAEEGYRLHQMKQALVSGVDVNTYDRDGRTPLITHICQSPPKEEESAIHAIVMLLVNHRADVQMIDRDGHPALYYALKSGFSKCVAVLIQHGARVNHRADGGHSLRMIARENLLLYLAASNVEDRRKLKHWLAIMSALNDGKAILNPTKLEEWGTP